MTAIQGVIATRRQAISARSALMRLRSLLLLGSGAHVRLGQYSRSRRRSLITPLAPSIGDPVLDLHLDWSARVGDAAPYFLAHGAAYLFGHCGERLASGSPAAFKGAVIGVE